MKFRMRNKWLVVVLILLFIGISSIPINCSKPIEAVVSLGCGNVSLFNNVGLKNTIAGERADKTAEIISMVDKSTGRYFLEALVGEYPGRITESEVCASRAYEEKTYDLSDDNMFYYDKRYAVIIVGYYGDEQHYNWFTNDAQRQYNVLTRKYGFNDSDVYVLLTLKEEWADNLSVDPAIVDYDATEENITMIFEYLETIIDEDDLLYVVVINHGGDNHHIDFWQLGIHVDFWQSIFAHDTYFGLEKTGNVCIEESNIEDDLGYYGNRSVIDNRVYDHELNDYTKDIDARRIIFVLQPCFSGGFINDLSKKNHVVLTASREVQLAFAPFIGYFYHGLNGSADDGNNDGRLSLGEVYEYTASRVYQWIDNNPDGNMGQLQHPLIDDNGNKIGSRYNGWFGYDPSRSNKDGFVAARIYNLSYEEI